MHEADVDQRHPGHRRPYQQQAGRDQLRGARSGGRRLDCVIVVAVLVMTIFGVGVRCMRVVVVLDGIAARIARMRPENRDQAGQNGALNGRKTIAWIIWRVNPSSD
jgi:hypothetical protein